MSETKLATKADLKEMYDRMLPYMGGMPEMLANKFSKGDLYSTDEKMIGQWIDGKPLYQRTFVFEMPYSSSGTSVTVADLAALNIDLITHCQAIHFDSSARLGGAFNIYANNGSAFVWWDLANNKLKANNTISSYNSRSCYVTIQYTKNTDSAISIGSDTDYSTDEKIVGTWIDGKTIYQKTIDCGAMPKNTEKSVSHNITNLDRIISVIGNWVNANHTEMGILPREGYLNNQYYINMYVTSTDIILSSDTDQSARSGYVTLQYTKTT